MQSFSENEPVEGPIVKEGKITCTRCDGKITLTPEEWEEKGFAGMAKSNCRLCNATGFLDLSSEPLQMWKSGLSGNSRDIIRRAMLKKHKFAEVPKLSESVGAYRFQWGLYLQGVKPQRYFLRHYNEKVNSTDAIQIHYEKDNFK